MFTFYGAIDVFTVRNLGTLGTDFMKVEIEMSNVFNQKIMKESSNSKNIWHNCGSMYWHAIPSQKLRYWYQGNQILMINDMLPV